MTSILGVIRERNGAPEGAPFPIPLPTSAAATRAAAGSPRVGRLDLQEPALERSRRVRVVIVLDQQRPGGVRRLLVPESVQEAEALDRSKEPRKRSLEAWRVDPSRRVAVEDRERPPAARRTGAVVVAVAADVVREVDHATGTRQIELEILGE